MVFLEERSLFQDVEGGGTLTPLCEGKVPTRSDRREHSERRTLAQPAWGVSVAVAGRLDQGLEQSEAEWGGRVVKLTVRMVQAKGVAYQATRLGDHGV